MVVVKGNVMYSCKAFYIGSEKPAEDKKGVEALQGPLRDKYQGNVSDVAGYDVTVTVMPDVLHVKYSNDIKPEFILPISTLSICAAVRGVESHGDPGNMKFVPVHSVITANEPDSEHPAIYATVMRSHRDTSESLLCHAFICNSTRDALHLVNATQTAHTAHRRGYTSNGAMKFFIDQSTEFDKTLRVSQSAHARKQDTKKIYMYQEDFDTRQFNADSKTYVTRNDDFDMRRTATITRSYDTDNVVEDGDRQTTYYIKAGDYRASTPPPAVESETVIVRADAEIQRPPTPPPQQTIYVDKPVVVPQKPIEYPKPRIIERPVMIKPPTPPPMEPQTIYVDKPIFKEMKWPDPPKPIVIERPCYIDPPPPPEQKAQTIVVDKPIVREYPRPPTPPSPIIQENLVYINAPEWPRQSPQKIIVDRPVVRPIGPAPPPPPPDIEERTVYIDPPEFPKQQAHRIVVEKPVFNPPKPAPRPPTPEIEEKIVYIDCPPYPKQEAQRIIVEKPIIKDPGPPPPAPKPIIIEKTVYIDGPKYQQQEPQRIIVEKPVLRDRGPPPPPPKPIIIEKIVYIDPPPWPKQEPQRIIVEKPVIRQRPPPPVPKPVVIEKPVYVDVPAPPMPEPQRVIVEKPIMRTTYGLSETRREPSVYNYHYQHRPANVRSSYVVRSTSPQRGLRRYAISEVGDDRTRRVDYGSDGGAAYRLYGQPRDFRFKENQFMNERGFGRSIHQELRTSRGPNSYTYGGAYRMNERRGSVSS
ncbi:proteoglycan 4-like isoform X1 [Mya arenaria]|uniref:proteoglycan 4-like isoform X1 n=1 Tax=Mya arenaria TaxID=6604 RepID=UPI0022E0EBC1|nr:proteoglycan 4-like isoform X1 [Mya arenaria]